MIIIDLFIIFSWVYFNVQFHSINGLINNCYIKSHLFVECFVNIVHVFNLPSTLTERTYIYAVKKGMFLRGLARETYKVAVILLQVITIRLR